MNPGDHLITSRGWYAHHGIYIGNGKVIHYSGLADGLSTGTICEVSLAEFENGDPACIRHHHNALPPKAIVQRAKSRMGEDNYNLFSNNCEHFATWCVTGEHNSQQISQLAVSPGMVVLQAAVARIKNNMAMNNGSQLAQLCFPSTLLAWEAGKTLTNSDISDITEKIADFFYF